MTFTSDNDAPTFALSVNSLCRVDGDFDAQVEYRLTTWPPANGTRLALAALAVGRLERANWGDGNEVYLTVMADGAGGVTQTTHTAGRLRLTRTGDTLAGYYYSSGSWVLVHSHSDPEHTADTDIQLAIWGHNSTPGVEVVFENFSLTADAMSCPPGAGAFTPTFTYTFDEVAPDNPDILPADDECPVGAPCKFLWWMEIPEGQPLGGVVSGVFGPPSIVAFADAAVVPDGAIVGKFAGSIRVGPVGSCATEGTILPWEMTGLDATMDPGTTTGSPSDLSSFSNWPTQLNSVRDDFLTAHPGSVLSARMVASMPWPDQTTLIVNALFFTQTDGSIAYIGLAGDPTGALPPPTYDLCSPFTNKVVGLGISADNPDTPEDEGGIPLRTCIEAGTHTVTASLDRNDTPPGDPVVLEDTAICSPNTPVGTDVPVPLNGGTQALGGIDVTFSEVSGGGSTSVVTTTTGPPPPTGFRIVGLAELPLYFDINTDTSYSGDLTVCIRYDETQVAGPEANLRLMQRVDGFVDITTSIDPASNVICGTTTHLSIFVVADSTPPPPEPPPLGGSGVFPDTDGAGGSSGVGFGVVAGVLAAATAGALALGGTAWYARRREQS